MESEEKELDSAGIERLRAEYEQAVRELKLLAEKGLSAEEIARRLHAERRTLANAYKLITPKDLREKIYVRNLRKYGDRLGPTIDWLRSRGKSWEDIIESASRPGGEDLKKQKGP